MSSEGWVCPKCGAVYAPWVQKCEKCSGDMDYRNQRVILPKKYPDFPGGSTGDPLPNDHVIIVCEDGNEIS